MSHKLELENYAVSEVYTFKGYSIFMRRNTIIQLKFEQGFHSDIEDAKNMVRTITKVKGDGKCLLLVIYAEDNTFTKENREYIASDEVSAIIKADGLVIKGLALRIIGNGYLKINKPKRPTRLFNTKDDAVAWLKQFQ